MKSLVVDVPAMYADHHVVEVRRILFEIPGVEAIDASAAFHAVGIEYDPDKTSEDALKRALDESGYLGDLEIPLESGEPTVETEGERYFRHTEAFETVADVISFGQDVSSSERPLWPCPGMSVLRTMDE
jgi:copper chaperone CopZ